MTNEMPKEAGFKCNCPECGGRPYLPCEAIEELASLRSQLSWIQGRFDSANARASHAENALEARDSALTQLRARVKEFEASRSLVAMDQLIRITEQNLELKARIRELEEAMPTADRIGIMAGQFSYFGDMKTAGECIKMAEKIDKVIKK